VQEIVPTSDWRDDPYTHVGKIGRVLRLEGEDHLTRWLGREEVSVTQAAPADWRGERRIIEHGSQEETGNTTQHLTELPSHHPTDYARKEDQMQYYCDALDDCIPS